MLSIFCKNRHCLLGCCDLDSTIKWQGNYSLWDLRWAFSYAVRYMFLIFKILRSGNTLRNEICIFFFMGKTPIPGHQHSFESVISFYLTFEIVRFEIRTLFMVTKCLFSFFCDDEILILNLWDNKIAYPWPENSSTQ